MKYNKVLLYGRVSKQPTVMFNDVEKQYTLGILKLDTVRMSNIVEDGVDYTKHEYPMIISEDNEKCSIIANLKENDVVLIKGVVSTKTITKTAYCESCGAPHSQKCSFMYITPICINKIRSYEIKNDAINDVLKNKEISNNVQLFGTLIKDPKMVTTKKKIQITQYQVAVNRKYRIKQDNPSIKTDYPIIKTYGEDARNDKMHLRYQSEIMADGYLQARKLIRKFKCDKCNSFSKFEDISMEIVSIGGTEYVSNFKTKEDIQREFNKTVEEINNELMKKGYNDTLTEDEISEDIFGNYEEDNDY